MEATVLLPIEAHPIETRTGEICSSCGDASVTSVDVALAHQASLEVIGRFVGTSCGSCGDETVHRS